MEGIEHISSPPFKLPTCKLHKLLLTWCSLIALTCRSITCFCPRYEKRHAIKHWSDVAHHYSLELETQQIWDYVGDKYVHRLNQSKGDGKLVTVNSRCTAVDGECTTCGYDEDSSFSGALFTSKVDSVIFFSLISFSVSNDFSSESIEIQSSSMSSLFWCYFVNICLSRNQLILFYLNVDCWRVQQSSC